ncbi:MAG: cysteine desulfurase NifS [Clostridiales bacterium]|jgi:cysteine desulfurase|nr:cysteine desulfurase NifS [Clostridiales bacterium]
MSEIYFDNAATTRVRPEVAEAMRPYLDEMYGNPSSIHKRGREAKSAVETAREQVAALIGADPKEIYFTSGGTEADNWAIFGAVRANAGKGRHIITSAIEHHAVLNTVEYLVSEGLSATYLPVDKYGLVNCQAVEEAIRPDTVLISIMFANNEVGVIEPTEEIGRLARSRGVLFHTDAVQAVGALPINVRELGPDMLSISGHKIYGPKGIGALYIRKGTRVKPLLFGGVHEMKRRAGTENVPGIVGFGRACELAREELAESAEKTRRLRDLLIKEVLGRIPYAVLNGHPEKRLPGNVNISFGFVEGESILLSLDLKGIAASSGSACTSGSLDPSHVLLAMGLSHETAHGSVRMTLGKYNTEDQVRTVVDELERIIARLRKMSPLYESVEKK